MGGRKVEEFNPIVWSIRKGEIGSFVEETGLEKVLGKVSSAMGNFKLTWPEVSLVRQLSSLQPQGEQVQVNCWRKNYACISATEALAQGSLELLKR